MDSEELHDSDIKAAMDGEDMPPGTLTPTGANGERPVVEGVPIQDDDEKMEIANAFRRGNLDGLLATCGFQRIEKEMIEESGREVGKNGIAVHLPDREDVAVRGYYRNVFKCEVCPIHIPSHFFLPHSLETLRPKFLYMPMHR